MIEQPVLSPGQERGAFDGRHCDTPTAFWMADRREIPIFYKAYPREAQPNQLKAPFRHHLLAAPSGSRIFFNSAPYGMEQMYSAVPV